MVDVRPNCHVLFRLAFTASNSNWELIIFFNEPWLLQAQLLGKCIGLHRRMCKQHVTTKLNKDVKR